MSNAWVGLDIVTIGPRQLVRPSRLLSRRAIMSTFSIDLNQAVELSHRLDPAREEYRMELDTRFTEDWPQFEKYRREDDAWYIISEIVMNTHCGTAYRVSLTTISRAGKTARTTRFRSSSARASSLIFPAGAATTARSRWLTCSRSRPARSGAAIWSSSTPAMTPIITATGSMTGPGSPRTASPGWRGIWASS